jgi:hypothetical protein
MNGCGRLPSGVRPVEIRNSPSTESLCGSPLRPDLTWTHYRTLMRVTSPEARSFYEVECARAAWSVRELKRQIDSMLFERLSRSRDEVQVLALARNSHEVHTPSCRVKDPYVLEIASVPSHRLRLGLHFTTGLRCSSSMLNGTDSLLALARRSSARSWSTGTPRPS